MPEAAVVACTPKMGGSPQKTRPPRRICPQKAASARGVATSAHFRSIEVATLEKRQRCFKNPCLTTIEFEFLFTLRRGADLP